MAGIRVGPELGFSVTGEQKMGRQCGDQGSPESWSPDGGTCLVGKICQAWGGSWALTDSFLPK